MSCLLYTSGLNSMPYNHFGSAPEFVVWDGESNVVKSISNGDLGHEHGKCNPIKALSGAVSYTHLKHSCLFMSFLLRILNCTIRTIKILKYCSSIKS